jgi:type II secretion system GspH-like protein
MRWLSGLDGYSVLELMMVMGIGVTVSAAAVPQYLTALDDFRTNGAARHIAGRLQRARMEAVMRSTTVGIQFVQSADGYSYAVYADGNSNGVLSRDIQRGVDAQTGAPERLPDLFAGVEFGAIAGLPAVDPGGASPSADPIRMGSGNLASFSATGSSSSGTVYIRGRHGAQYAVRVFGETGKTRLLKFERRTGLWKEQ